MIRGIVLRVALLTVSFSLSLPAGISAGAAGPTYQGDPQAIAEVQAAQKKFLEASTWRVHITAEGHSQTMEYAAPDKYHLLVPGNQAMDMFYVGSETWARTGGKCQKLAAAPPIMNPRNAIDQSSDTKITVTRGGPDTVEGTPVRTYMLIVDRRGEHLTEKLYVATATGLVRRFEVRSAKGVTVVDYFDYGAPIAINNPPC